MIFARLDEIGFWDLKDSYRGWEIAGGKFTGMTATDLSTQIVTATRDGVSKSVEDYYGTPQSLVDLEALIDQPVEIDQWLKELLSKRQS